MTKKRNTFSPEEKTKIIKEHFLGKTLVSDLCKTYGFKPVTFHKWQGELFENGALAFSSTKKTNPSKLLKKENKLLREKLTQKDSIIAEIMNDHVKLKKKFGES